MHRTFLFCAAAAALLFAAADWPQFRGPGGSGVSEERELPEQWSASRNVVWKTRLPGPGSSSPIVVGDKVFVTCYSGYGLRESEPGNLKSLVRHLVCLDRASGKILWDKTVRGSANEQSYGGYIALHGYASSTPVSDGEKVYVFFGKLGVFAYSMDGERLWRTSVGTQTHDWGSATSPIVYDNLVIVNASVESGTLVALDRSSGKVVWRAREIERSWSTPLLVVPEGSEEPEVVVSMEGAIVGYSPESGKALWRCEGIPDYVCPSLVANEGIIYAMGGRGANTMAVRAGGRGNVTKSRVLWRGTGGANVPSPVMVDHHLYWATETGILFGADAAKGKRTFAKRLTSDRVYASPLAADGKLYVVSRQSGVYVLNLGSKVTLLAHNKLGDGSVFNASPVAHRGQLLLRSNRALYCIGNEDRKSARLDRRP